MANPNDFRKEDRVNGNPRVFQVETVEDFVTVTTWLYMCEDVIFRGQRCDWPLVPAVGRVSKRSKWLDNEQQVIDEFRREALPYLQFVPNNSWQWLAVAQHNRLPTRLLDWSKSPLVALWFVVCEPAKGGEPGIVWAHCYQKSEVIYTPTTEVRDPFSINRTVVYFPEHVFPYIQAQSGVFTVHHRSPDNHLFVPFEETNTYLTKIEIPADSFSVIRNKLFRLGISPASLFPGLSGLVGRIKYQNEKLEDEPPGW